jgi:hypothetical protein
MSDVVWDVVSDMVSDMVSDIVWDVMSDVMSDVVSDIALQNRPAIHTVSSGWNSHQVPGSRFQVPGSRFHQSSIINHQSSCHHLPRLGKGQHCTLRPYSIFQREII